MVIEEIAANIKDLKADELEKRSLDRVYMESADLVKRIQRVKTESGFELGIQLKNPHDLEAGDILYMDDESIIMIDVLKDDLLVIRPKNMYEMGNIAHQLGNRHMPAQFEGEEMLVQYDYLVEELLQELDLPYVREERQVKQPFRHVEQHSHA